MDLIDLTVTLAISQLTMLGLSFLVLQRCKLASLMSLFSFCLVAYLLGRLTMLPDNEFIDYSLARLSTVRPLVLWLIAFYLFVDGGKVSTSIWILMAVFVLARAIGVPLYDPSAEWSNFWFNVIYFIPQLILLGFSIHCVYLAVVGYRIDLMEQRRRIRLLFVFGMGILTVVMVGNSFFSFVDPFLNQISLFAINPLPNFVFPLYIFVLTLGINLTISRFGVDAFTLQTKSGMRSANRRFRNPAHKKQHMALLSNLENAMERDKLYQKSGLSIVRLAEALSIHEYQLRQLINQELHYRNFNQFLNHYRIIDSCERLLDSAEYEQSIATVALDVGFSSLSSFNKAFKEIKGITPSAFRQSGGSERGALTG